MLRIFNVGQADAMELVPVEGCRFHGDSFLVDCGQGRKNVFNGLKNDSICLVLTHSHRDHIGGLSRLFGEEQHLKIRGLWLPLYSDEIEKIANFMFSLKGVETIVGKTVAEEDLKTIIHVHRLLKVLLTPFECKSILGVAAGMNMCDHLSILNPPIDPDHALGLKKGTARSYWEYQKKNNHQTLRNWLTEEEFERKWGDFIAEGWDYEVPNLTEFGTDDFESRMLFIYGFFSKYEAQISNFVESRQPDDFENVANAVKQTSNNLSIVLEYNTNSFSCLLTGDIDSATLKRCMLQRERENVMIFKFPHHGSKDSLHEESLKY